MRLDCIKKEVNNIYFHIKLSPLVHTKCFVQELQEGGDVKTEHKGEANKYITNILLWNSTVYQKLPPLFG